MRAALHLPVAGTALILFALLVGGCTPAAAQVSSPQAPSIGAVVSEIPRDLWRFLSWETGAIVGSGGAAALAAHIWDDDLADKVEVSVRLNDAMAPGHTYGAFSVQAFLGVGIYTTGWLAKKPRFARAGADIMRSQILGQVYVQALKYTVGRERPNESNTQSFPSGHSASAFATAGVLQRHYGWKAGVPATVVAAYVAAARVKDNRHYLSDVIFGGTMGIAAQRTVTLRAGRYDAVVSPDLRPGYTGVAVTMKRP